MPGRFLEGSSLMFGKTSQTPLFCSFGKYQNICVSQLARAYTSSFSAAVHYLSTTSQGHTSRSEQWCLLKLRKEEALLLIIKTLPVNLLICLLRARG